MRAEDIERLERVGKGSFGEVFRGRYKPTGEIVAIKTIDLEEIEEEDDVQLEVQTLLSVQCPYIVKLYASLVVGAELWLVMEYVNGGSAFDLIKYKSKLDEDAIAIIVKQTLYALEYLHRDGKIHRDIKAANILLHDNGGVKLADFGVCGQLTGTVMKRFTFVGTPYWISPEVIKQQGYDWHADIWSLGITCLEMAQGQPPYFDMHPMKALFAISSFDPPKMDTNAYSSLFIDFVSSCLNKNPQLRPSATELLQHPFIVQARHQSYVAMQVQQMMHSKSNMLHRKPSLHRPFSTPSSCDETIMSAGTPSPTGSHESEKLSSLKWTFDKHTGAVKAEDVNANRPKIAEQQQASSSNWLLLPQVRKHSISQPILVPQRKDSNASIELAPKARRYSAPALISSPEVHYYEDFETVKIRDEDIGFVNDLANDVHGWRPLMEQESYSAFISKNKLYFCKSKPNRVYKTSGLVTYALDGVLHTLLSTEFRHMYEQQFTQPAHVETLLQDNYAASIMHEIFPMIWPMSNRDLVTANTVIYKPDAAHARYIIVKKSCKHDLAPEKKNAVRAKMISGWVLEYVNDHVTKYSHILFMDMGKSMESIMTLMFKKRASQIFTGISKALAMNAMQGFPVSANSLGLVETLQYNLHQQETKHLAQQNNFTKASVSTVN